jgi:hypothetical protein
MARPPAGNVLPKLRKLARLAADLRRGGNAPVTRLTTLKSLCREPALANRFVTRLARKSLERVKRGKRRSGRLSPKTARAHQALMAEALDEMEAYIENPGEADRPRLWELLGRMRAEQNDYQPIPFGAVRLIHDWDLLLVENALHCLLEPHAAGYWAYHMARDYAERYDSHSPNGLVRASASLLQEIVDFLGDLLGVDPSPPPAPVKRGKKSSPK